ncbi:hypothetical protein Pmani_003589 [Petrolisthes manimaculis]|uniref:Uncharacterized protein n=1 Tax=Petrolisthes manimaculis TaxID=1843537 RepID=A0AAE1QFB1_9EUCA|nr:hypothetical protein Pmani_003589 [Petrolisthes manimaculis]
MFGAGVADVVGSRVETGTEGGVKYILEAGVVVFGALVENRGAERDNETGVEIVLGVVGVASVLETFVAGALGDCVRNDTGTGEESDFETDGGSVFSAGSRVGYGVWVSGVE